MLQYRNKLLVIILVVLACSFAVPVMAGSYTSAIENFKKSPQVQPFFADCYGYAVFPTVGKGAFWIGGAYGRGLVYRADRVTGRSSLIKASIGFQVGGQAFSEIVFFQDKRAYDEFTSGSFQFDATASAVVVTAGVQMKVGTDGISAGASLGPATGEQAATVYQRGMITFVHIKGGLMYEVAIGGQRFGFTPN